MTNLFIYGTLKKSKTQKEVIGRTVKGIEDILNGYQKSKVEIEGETYPALIPDKNSSVEGLILSVNDKELNKIDTFETNAYKRKEVILESGKKAWVYVKK